jgi:hypothetical protein
MKRLVFALIAATCTLIQTSSELQAQTPDERAALKPGPHTDAHGGGCCCLGCSGPVPTPSEIIEKA